MLLVLTYPYQYPISKPTKIAPKFDEQEQAAAGQVCHIEESRILLAIITLDVDAFESLLDYTDIIHMTHISTYTQTLHCCATLNQETYATLLLKKKQFFTLMIFKSLATFFMKWRTYISFCWYSLVDFNAKFILEIEKCSIH